MRTAGPSGSRRAHFRPEPPRSISSDSHSCDTAFAIFCGAGSREVIARAVRTAQRTPSVCNRQAWRVHVYTSPEDKDVVLRTQDGNAGFGHLAASILLVSSDTRVYVSSGERHQAYVDGGMFAMSLVYALQAQGVASCCLNLCNYFFQDVAVHRACRIPAWETPIMMIAIGYPARNSRSPCPLGSIRRPSCHGAPVAAQGRRRLRTRAPDCPSHFCDGLVAEGLRRTGRQPRRRAPEGAERSPLPAPVALSGDRPDPAQNLGIDVVDPGFDPEASRNRRSVTLLAKRLKCVAGAIQGKRRARERARSSDIVAAAYATADLVLDLSGDSYRDPPGGFAPAHHANLLAAVAMGTPYALVSQSLGPFRPWNRPFVRSLLNRASLVYIREKRTREILARLGVREERLQLAPDIAFALPASSPEPIWAERSAETQPSSSPMGRTLDQPPRTEAGGKTGNRYLEGMARLTAHVRAKYEASVLVIPHEINPPYYGPDDRTAAEALFVRMGKPAWMQLFRGDYDPSSLKGLIRECDALIASRMHAAIAGLSSGIPTLVVAWSHKYEGVMEEIGLEEFVWKPDSSGSDELVALFDRLWIQRDSLRSRLLGLYGPSPTEIAEMVLDRGLPSGFGPSRLSRSSRPPSNGRPDDRASRCLAFGMTSSSGMSSREAPEGLPRVSIAMPIYNEAESIDRTLAAVLDQDYPQHLTEILIAESQSADGTAERILRIIARHPDRCIRLLPNPVRTAGAAMNCMILQAAGDIVVRVEGTSRSLRTTSASASRRSRTAMP